MIQGKTKTEATYRAKQLDSSSSLKDFSLDRKKYYRKYILGEQVEDKDTQAAVIGRVVETLLLEPQEFDNRFYMSACAETPTALMLSFVEALYRHSVEATDESGVLTKTMDELMQMAYKDSGFKIKYEAVVTKFVGSDAEIYYEEIRKVRSRNLTVVTAEDVSNAEKIVEELRNNDVTSQVVNLVNSARYSVLNQFQVENYEIEGLVFKSMMDKVIVDHNECTVQVYDLKCVWAVEGFYEEYYLYRRAYIQGYLYFKALEIICGDEASEWYGYSVLPPKFIVCDSTNYYNPLIYAMNQQDILDSQNGFEHKGRIYPGVMNIIEDLKWAVANDKWNISRKNHISNGIVNIKG